MRSVYLDNNATTQVDPAVVERMNDYFGENFGNASSVHSFGQRARAGLEEARRQVASLIDASPAEIIFTGGGTEADNLAIKGVALARQEKGKHLITSRIEHPAVLRTCESLERDGFEVTYLDVGSDGAVDPGQLEQSLRDDTILVSIMFANNETGVIQPVEEMAPLVRERGIYFHCDAVQGVAKASLPVDRFPVDLLSISAHKFHGPKGVGALYVRKGTPLQPQMLGGSHERRMRAGTENVPAIVGFGQACQLAAERMEDFVRRVSILRDRLENGILNAIEGVRVNGAGQRRLPHVTNISFEGIEGEALLVALDFQGIAVSTGAACASGSISPSHVLAAMGLPDRWIRGSIRFSLSRLTTEEEIDYVLDVLPGIVQRMREMAVSSSS
ncbi:MAG TPA: cysteine desulfurase NifS [Acidobacteriota bacterium]|nr:cysteine desulfurase NifS [Acidobacteriota bacterium]